MKGLTSYFMMKALYRNIKTVQQYVFLKIVMIQTKNYKSEICTI